jgi:hypothetical protein
MRSYLTIMKLACAAICLTMVGFAPQASTAATWDVVADFNDTGIQPAAGNPFTYGTETALNTGFALLRCPISNLGGEHAAAGISRACRWFSDGVAVDGSGTAARTTG